MSDIESQLTKLKIENAQLRSDFNAASKDAQVLRVAYEKGIPPDQLSRIVADTPEQIEQNADRVLMGERGGFDGGTVPSSGTPPPSSPDELIRQAAGF
jgi:hypothetical protein